MYATTGAAIGCVSGDPRTSLGTFGSVSNELGAALLTIFWFTHISRVVDYGCNLLPQRRFFTFSGTSSSSTPPQGALPAADSGLPRAFDDGEWPSSTAAAERSTGVLSSVVIAYSNCAAWKCCATTCASSVGYGLRPVPCIFRPRRSSVEVSYSETCPGTIVYDKSVSRK